MYVFQEVVSDSCEYILSQIIVTLHVIIVTACCSNGSSNPHFCRFLSSWKSWWMKTMNGIIEQCWELKKDQQIASGSMKLLQHWKRWKARGLSGLVHTHTRTYTTILWLSGFCLGQPGWDWRNIHPLTPLVVISRPLSASSIYYDPQHPLCSIYMPDSLFPQSLSKFSLVYLLAWHPQLYTRHQRDGMICRSCSFIYSCKLKVTFSF